METVTISPKYQVVIPKAIRTRLKLRAGQKVQAIVYEDRISSCPSACSPLEGFLKGTDSPFLVERDRV